MEIYIVEKDGSLRCTIQNRGNRVRIQDEKEEKNLLEGRNAVIEFLRSGQDCDKVFAAQGARVGDIIALAKERGVPVVTCDRRKLDGMSTTGNHQGVMAQVAAHAYASLDELFEHAQAKGKPLCLYYVTALQTRTIWGQSFVQQKPQAHMALSFQNAAQWD